MNKVCRQFTISGHVQGVGYRAWTHAKATALGLTGWVKNLPNGDVQALICGPENQVLELAAACHQGPQFARVSNVTVNPIDNHDFDTFTLIE